MKTNVCLLNKHYEARLGLIIIYTVFHTIMEQLSNIHCKASQVLFLIAFFMFWGFEDIFATCVNSGSMLWVYPACA